MALEQKFVSLLTMFGIYFTLAYSKVNKTHLTYVILSEFLSRTDMRI